MIKCRIKKQEPNMVIIMIINVENPVHMINDICAFLNISEDILKDSIDNFFESAKTDLWYDMEIFNKLSEQFVDMHFTEPLEKIFFCHLTRSIATPEILMPVYELLTSTNDYSEFLNENGLFFEKYNNRLSMIYKGRRVLENEIYDSNRFENNHNRLAGRLGFCGEPDYCINGFTFAINPEYSTDGYYYSLKRSPELLQDIDSFLDTNLCEEFFKISKYYFAICEVPLQKVIFDGRDDLNSCLNRTKSYLSLCFEFLASWYRHESDSILPNTMLRMDDYTKIKVDHYIEL